MFACQILRIKISILYAPHLSKSLTLEDFGDGSLVEFLELKVLQKVGVEAEKSCKGDFALSKFEPFNKLLLLDLILKPLQLLECHLTGTGAVILFVGSEEDFGIQVKLEDMPPSCQVTFRESGRFRDLSHFLPERNNLLCHSLFLLRL